MPNQTQNPTHANCELSREVVEQSFVYKADLSDVNHHASEVLCWIGTLITEAKRSEYEGTKNTLLDIAQYLCEDNSNSFYNEYQLLNDGLNHEVGGVNVYSDF